MILGLTTTGTTSSYRSEKSRRKILHQYPRGGATLMYLLSLMEDGNTDKTEFGHWEEREECVKTLTATSGGLGGGGNGPFTNSGLTTSSAAAGFNVVADTVYGLFVDDASQFRVYDVIWIRQVPNGAGSANLDVRGTVTDVNTSTNVIKFRAAEAVTSVSNDTDANDITVYYVSSSAPEGDRSVKGAVSFPLEVTNYTQIFRHTVGPFTASQLKEGMRFDSSGTYREALHKTCTRHMKGMELAALRGRRKSTTTTNADGDTVPVKMTGGLEYFLFQYEKGNTTNSGVFDYRPGGADVSASAWATTDEKRIIDVNGSITRRQLEMLVERLFRFNGDMTDEKLVLCGNGFMTVFHNLVQGCSYKIDTLEASKDTFGMDLTRWVSPWGTLLFKTHPLLNESSHFLYDAYCIDVGSLRYVPLNDRDTQLLTDRQAPDFDGRKDELITEAGFDISFPERHMYIKNCNSISL